MEISSGSFSVRAMQGFQPGAKRKYQAPLVFPRVFGPRQCEKIVQTGKCLPMDNALVSSAAVGRAEPGIRRAKIAWVDPLGELAWVFEKLGGIVRRANRIYQYDLIGFTEDGQFTSYDEAGAFYDWHQDGLEGELATRKLSLVVQLSPEVDYSGADLDLFSLSSDESVRDSWVAPLRVQGSVIAFPAFEYHRVTPLAQGSRHSMVCWVGGPPFR